MIVPRLCIIEDDFGYQFLVKEIVKMVDPGIEVLTFNDGKAAADFFSAHIADPAALPQIIFLDLNMPVMDGWEFLDEFQQLQTQLLAPIPLYILSSSISATDIARSKEISLVNDFIQKPLEEERLKNIIDSVKTNS